ncbi:hypothetical protein BOX15_Mlig024364g2 [Macrostomum lignano]|uniref:Uncharacterized protein n=1 Tax=Macrostomum lignano TaxID=282301 RepID=A0A267H1D5_9PLAT|nr:hypothetical protein BOX15_Mlig024364g2 [Macrostomum lignano]
MASNLSGCSYSELEESVCSKALIASQLLESMGQEPGPPDDYFERLSVALERRRAAVTREQAEWQQKWLQLRDALQKASELPQCTLPVDELCDIEAELVYAINSDRRLARRGVWNTTDVQVKTNELIAALRIHWEPRKNPDSKISESESTYSPVVSQAKSFTKNALSEEACSSFRDCVDSSSQKESELQEVSLIDTPKLPECSAPVYDAFRLIFKSSWNIFSGAFIPNSIIVLEFAQCTKQISFF